MWWLEKFHLNPSPPYFQLIHVQLFNDDMYVTLLLGDLLHECTLQYTWTFCTEPLQTTISQFKLCKKKKKKIVHKEGKSGSC
jgi:hypothetical protein